MEDFNEKYKQKNPFTVPEGYFDNLTERIVERVEVLEKLKKKVKEKTQENSEIVVVPSVGIVWRLKPYMAWVAVFVVTIALYPLITPREQQVTEEDVATLDSSEEYVFDADFNPTAEEIIEYLTVEVEDYELIIAGIY